MIHLRWTARCVAPVRERGLKLLMRKVLIVGTLVAPVRERGLKPPQANLSAFAVGVAPVRERGLKHFITYFLKPRPKSLP